MNNSKQALGAGCAHPVSGLSSRLFFCVWVSFFLHSNSLALKGLVIILKLDRKIEISRFFAGWENHFLFRFITDITRESVCHSSLFIKYLLLLSKYRASCLLFINCYYLHTWEIQCPCLIHGEFTFVSNYQGSSHFNGSMLLYATRFVL